MNNKGIFTHQRQSTEKKTWSLKMTMVILGQQLPNMNDIITIIII